MLRQKTIPQTVLPVVFFRQSLSTIVYGGQAPNGSPPETLWPPKVLIENTEDTLPEEKRFSLSAITVDSNI